LCDASRPVTDAGEMSIEFLRVGWGRGAHQGTLEAMIMPAIGVCEDSVLVLQATVTPDWRVVYGREGASERPGGWKSRVSYRGVGSRRREEGRLPAFVALNMGRRRR